MINHYYTSMEFDFRTNLRNELDYQGLTVKELSAKTGIPKPTLSCYLSSRKTMPTADAAVKIAKALNVTVEYLVTGETKSIPENKDLKKENQRNVLQNNFNSIPKEMQNVIKELIKTAAEIYKS